MRIHLLLILSIAFGIASCTGRNDRLKNNGLYIVTTTGIIEDAVKNIVKDSAKVEALMGPGVDPHLYKVSQGDLSKLTNASVVIYNGLHLEGKMGEVLESLSRQKPVIAISNGLSKDRLRNVSGFAGGYDPHIWFNVSLWKDAVAYISREIQKLDSSHAPYYAKNTQVYLAQLDSLHEWVQKQMSTVPADQRVLITAHDAFGYFGQAYNVQVEGLQGISTVAEPGLKDISQITDLIVRRKIKAIFVESSVPKKTVESVVEGAHLKGQPVKIGGTLYSDALGQPETPAGTYIGMVKENVHTIVSALR